ncbi:hypothetical protein F4819DRAFT_450960, partial [Hypoxylon fuscum]
MVYNDTPIQSPVKQREYSSLTDINLVQLTLKTTDHGSRENLAVASAPAILQLSRPLQSQERLQQRKYLLIITDANIYQLILTFSGAWIEDWVQNLVEEYTEQLRQARLHEQAREQERLRQQHEAERWQASARQRELAYHERELALRRSQARLRETAQVQAHEGEEALARRRAEQQERALVERSLLWAGQQASQREFATSEQDPMDD